MGLSRVQYVTLDNLKTFISWFYNACKRQCAYSSVEEVAPFVSKQHSLYI